MRTQKDIKMKDGTTVAKGATVVFVEGSSSRCLVTGSRLEPYRVKVTSAFKAPSIWTLQKWENEGFCKSICGEKVEPDGHDHHGSPSWMLALGLI